MEATFSSWFLGPYKVSKIGFGLFSYALQHAKHTIASFMDENLAEYLVFYSSPQYLSNVTFGTSFAFQMREE